MASNGQLCSSTCMQRATGRARLPDRLLLAAYRALELGHLLDLLHLKRVAAAALHGVELLHAHLAGCSWRSGLLWI